MDLRSIWPTGDLRQGMPMCRMCQSTAGLGDAALQLRQLAAAISSQARRLVGEMSSPANRESLRSRTTTSDTASQGSRLSFSPTLLSLYIAISTEVLIAGGGLCAIVTQCTTVCWGLLCLHSGYIPAGATPPLPRTVAAQTLEIPTQHLPPIQVLDLSVFFEMNESCK